MFQEIKASRCDGCYSRVTDFIPAWRQGEAHVVAKSAFVPLQLELGETFQSDRSEEGLVVGGIYRKLQHSAAERPVNGPRYIVNNESATA